MSVSKTLHNHHMGSPVTVATQSPVIVSGLYVLWCMLFGLDVCCYACSAPGLVSEGAGWQPSADRMVWTQHRMDSLGRAWT
jgi:hypothetical protein